MAVQTEYVLDVAAAVEGVELRILPVIPSKSKSYSLKETYYNSLAPEKAARELRKLVIEPE